jgi:predicted nucleic acid-binding protein
VTLLVDTSAWSLALRRDGDSAAPEAIELRRALLAGETLITTGIILQELLQGFSGPKAQDEIIARFATLPLITPDRADHIEAAALRNGCRRAGVQIATIDALIAQLALRHGLTLLTTDGDFRQIAKHAALKIWTAR